ncbi:hypothetical protein [Desulfoluna spongiiphila]|uniref:SWIM-type domain-containing protein n=1 Tax=Desulfoluna spongiiphila TaxID=419481 RepID=A0A1G5II11_9BACT|nr:hypothetical protein [Desulfoluna spongiiphila]SCY75644.1 hypothetical protein SAMN05216233_12027 [Desulfoluna spongiiphila]VVS90897.1 zinc finger swim-type [Desulfoluna spongiiphila]
MTRHLNPFHSLTHDDIDAWIEGPTADKGKKLHETACVEGIALTEDGDLLAWVEDSARHAVMIFFEDQTLTSVCSCAGVNDCEHAAAAVYAYLAMMAGQEELPIATEDDDRLSLLNELTAEPSEIETYLRQLSREQLMDLVLDLADELPDVVDELSFRAEESFTR